MVGGEQARNLLMDLLLALLARSDWAKDAEPLHGASQVCGL